MLTKCFEKGQNGISLLSSHKSISNKYQYSDPLLSWTPQKAIPDLPSTLCHPMSSVSAHNSSAEVAQLSQHRRLSFEEDTHVWYAFSAQNLQAGTCKLCSRGHHVGTLLVRQIRPASPSSPLPLPTWFWALHILPQEQRGRFNQCLFVHEILWLAVATCTELCSS